MMNGADNVSIKKIDEDMESNNQNRVMREVWCENCKSFTIQNLSKIVTLPETLKVKIWGHCLKCNNYWINKKKRSC